MKKGKDPKGVRRAVQPSSRKREAAAGGKLKRAPLLPLRNNAGRPTQKEIERRKDHVLEVAADLFVTHGYMGVSLVEISKRAGVATRTVYQHFGDKETLFKTVVSARELSPMNERPSIEKGDTLFGLLMRLSHYVCDVAFRDRSVDLMRLIIAETQRFPDTAKKITNAALNALLHNLSGVFQQLEEVGAIKQDDHALTSRLFLDLILGFAPLRYYTNWEAHSPTDTELAAKVDLFVMGRFGPDAAKTSKTRRIAAPAVAGEARTSSLVRRREKALEN